MIPCSPHAPDLARSLPYRGRLRGQDSVPMDLTATVTAIAAIVSFGFLAAVILGTI